MQHHKADMFWKCIADARSPDISEIEALAQEMLRQGFVSDDHPSTERAMRLAQAALLGDRARR